MTVYSLDVLLFQFGTSLLFQVQSNCCFLICLQVSQEASQVVWYSHLLKNFPQFIVIHTVKDFGIVNKTEIDVFLELSSFLMIQWMLAIWSLVPLPFLKPAWTSGSSWFTYCWSLAWRILSITLLLLYVTYVLNTKWFACADHKVYILIILSLSTRIYMSFMRAKSFLYFIVLRSLPSLRTLCNTTEVCKRF